MSPSARDSLGDLWILMGDGEEEHGRAVCRHLGMSLEPRAVASMQTRRAEAQLCLSPGLAAQGGLSPFTHGGLQSCRCCAGGSRVQPHPWGHCP